MKKHSKLEARDNEKPGQPNAGRPHKDDGPRGGVPKSKTTAVIKGILKGK